MKSSKRASRRNKDEGIEEKNNRYCVHRFPIWSFIFIQIQRKQITIQTDMKMQWKALPDILLICLHCLFASDFLMVALEEHLCYNDCLLNLSLRSSSKENWKYLETALRSSINHIDAHFLDKYRSFEHSKIRLSFLKPTCKIEPTVKPGRICL